jgi:hypothetical protein
LLLRLVVTSFPAIQAVVLTVFGKTHPGIRLAKRAVLVAIALLLGFVTNPALKLFDAHKAEASLSEISRASILPVCADKIKLLNHCFIGSLIH